MPLPINSWTCGYVISSICLIKIFIKNLSLLTCHENFFITFIGKCKALSKYRFWINGFGWATSPRDVDPSSLKSQFFVDPDTCLPYSFSVLFLILIEHLDFHCANYYFDKSELDKFPCGLGVSLLLNSVKIHEMWAEWCRDSSLAFSTLTGMFLSHVGPGDVIDTQEF